MDSTDVEELLCPESGIVSDFQEIDRILAAERYLDCVEHSDGLGVLSEAGSIGKSRVLRLDMPDGSVKFTTGDFSGIIEFPANGTSGSGGGGN